MKKKLMLIACMIITGGCLIGCSSSSSGSYEYNNDANYKKNVDDAANAWGKDAGYVDDVYHGLAGD